MEIPKATMEELELHKSADQLDQPIQLVPLRIRTLIGLIGLILFVVIIWSITASINVYVNGKGILTMEQGISEIKIPYSGKISQLNVVIGQHVEQGDILATVEQLDLVFNVKKIESQIRDYKTTLDWLLDHSKYEKRTATIEALNKRLKEINKLRGIKQTNIEETEKEIKEIDLKILELENYSAQRVFETRSKLIGLETELQYNKNQLRNQTLIISPYSGTIVDMSVNDGDVFTQGSSLFVIENQDFNKSNLTAIVYMNAYQGKKITPGMKVQLIPSTIALEEYGYIMGTVKSVSKYAQTTGGMNRVLRNQQLLEEFSSDGLPLLLTVQLIKDSSTFSGYKWTSGKGPSKEIVSGTLIKAKVITETKKPISFVIPL